MQRPNDERLIAYLDGELDESESAEIAAWLKRDAELRQRAAGLGESAALLRAAFDETLHEPLPERLVAAARGESGGDAGKMVDLAAARDKRGTRKLGDQRWWIGVAAAASLAALFIGTGVGYFAGSETPLGGKQVVDIAGPQAGSWLDNIAIYHKLYVNAGPDDKLRFDVPAGQKLPQDFHLPNLKPWGLDFQGVRFLAIEGQQATQLFYTTDNKALGPITIVVASSKTDLPANFEHRGDVNVLFWSHHGHRYAVVGSADIGYLWNIHNDIAYQLDTI
jgi:anti-sigma factor RsiW